MLPSKMTLPRLSHTAALILRSLSRGYCFGSEIMEVTGLPSGTVYPALRRLERDGLVESNWEPEEEANDAARPARRYYRVTATGKTTAAAVVERYPLLARMLPGKKA
jgi:PadR family transcriptional regulator PadR